MKKLAQGFNTAAQDSNPGSRSRESEALPLSYCAVQVVLSHSVPLTPSHHSSVLSLYTFWMSLSLVPEIYSFWIFIKLKIRLGDVYLFSIGGCRIVRKIVDVTYGNDFHFMINYMYLMREKCNFHTTCIASQIRTDGR